MRNSYSDANCDLEREAGSVIQFPHLRNSRSVHSCTAFKRYSKFAAQNYPKHKQKAERWWRSWHLTRKILHTATWPVLISSMRLIKRTAVSYLSQWGNGDNRWLRHDKHQHMRVSTREKIASSWEVFRSKPVNEAVKDVTTTAAVAMEGTLALEEVKEFTDLILQLQWSRCFPEKKSSSVWLQCNYSTTENNHAVTCAFKGDLMTGWAHRHPDNPEWSCSMCRSSLFELQ